MLPLSAGEDRTLGLLKRAIGRQAARTGNLVGRLFSVGGRAAFTSRGKIVALLRSSAKATAHSSRCGCKSVPPAAFVAMKAAMGAADPTRESRNDRRPR